MACDGKSQQQSVEELERRFAKLAIKAKQVDAQAQNTASKKGPQGTSIFRKPSREITEENFLDELERVERQWFTNKSKKTPQVPSREITEENFLDELERVERQLFINKSKKTAKTTAETEKMLSELEEIMMNLK
ncbi:oxidoreductase- 2OG-Fe(II) oxygenase family [Apiospora arundinis]